MTSSVPPHREVHYVNRAGWLRAAVLGANDGLVSTASLLVGMAASPVGGAGVLLAGTAALVAGAMSMAAGEYVSVSAQADIERADLARERVAIADEPDAEQAELRDIYVARGLDPVLAQEVARQLMATDALDAHARDELGITDTGSARPVQASAASALSFGAGASAPLLIAALSPRPSMVPAIIGGTLLSLALLGWLGARAGGGSAPRAVLRVLVWGGFAMAVTGLAGRLFGANL